MGKIVIGKSGLHQCFLFTSMVICVKKLIMVDKQTMAYDGVSGSNSKHVRARSKRVVVLI